MKKLLLIVTAATALSGLSAFGQGYFIFSGAVRGNWDLWSGVPRTSTNNHLAFLWATSGSPGVDAIMPSVATNNATPYSFVAAWTAIMSDPNFHIANTTDGIAAVATSASNGAWQYLPANASFGAQGTSPGAYQVFVIGWGGGFVDPAAAAAAGAPVGWSNPFTYNATSQAVPGLLMSQSGLLPFGVGIVPEPTTFAFAGLGAAALLIFRRRK